jgi:prepilin-type N-terminal cleavage/methylation domain-containing protein
MKTQITPVRCGLAFTLVELLVVMAVIAVLAALIFPAAGALKKLAAIKKARTELKQAELAIETYKGSFNHYPPDNPGNPELNQLYYELVGTTNTGGTTYLTDSGRVIASPAAFFGPNVSGFVNVSRGSGDEAQNSKNFVPGLKPSQYQEVDVGGKTGIVLGISSKGPLMLSDVNGISINPLRYVSTGPSNNSTTYDLWVDIIVGGKTNRISNWSERAEPVAY